MGHESSLERATLKATDHSELSLRELEDLLQAPAYVQAQALADGRISAAALLEHVLARVERLNPQLNAIIARDDANARSAAKAADEALARGERKPLLGVPISFKENFDIQGLVTSVGDPAWTSNIAERDAPAVAALREAGAVVIGKTNVPLALADLQSYNEVYGVTNNPWDLAHSPGGSSGGSAAALAAGFSALDIGTDIGGSIRIPAHFTGVFGHKPSFGLVYNGGLGVPPGKQSLRDLSVAGPLARSAQDLDIALQLLLNRDPLGSKAWRAQLPLPRHQNLQGFRVLLLGEWPGQEPSLSEKLVEQRLQVLAEDAGVAVVRKEDLPAGLWPDLNAAHQLYRSLLAASLPAVLRTDEDHTRARALRDATDEPDAETAWRRGPHLGHGEWLTKHEARLQLRRQWEQVFEHVDLILSPVLATSAFTHNHSQPKDERSYPVAFADGIRQIRFPDLFNWAGLPVLPGLPATSFPLGLGEDGLPIGAQAIGPFLEDRTPIYFAQLLQEANLIRFIAPPPLSPQV